MCRSPNIVTVNKCKILRWAGHLAICATFNCLKRGPLHPSREIIYYLLYIYKPFPSSLYFPLSLLLQINYLTLIQSTTLSQIYVHVRTLIYQSWY